MRTRKRTCRPATDRDLESGLSKSDARKNRENACKMQSQEKSLAKARFDIDGQIVLETWVKGRRTNRTM